MTDPDLPPPPDEEPGGLTVGLAEELVEASARHAQGELTDAEYLELRSRLLDRMSGGDSAAPSE